MSLINECQFRASAAGLADFVVASAVSGYFMPAQCTNPAVVDGNLYYWRAESDDLAQHELFQGTYTVAGTVVARTTILQSSNGGAKVNFSAAPRVRQVAPAQAFAFISADLGTQSSGTLTIDYTKGQLQRVICGGAFNLQASSAEGSIILKITNNASAGVITPLGFLQGSNSGDPLDTVNGHKFSLSIWTISGDSRYLVSAYQ